MRNISWLTGILIIIPLVAGVAWGAPQLTIHEPTFDFGYAPQNSVISHDFWLCSTGDEELKILKVVPG